MFVFCWGLTHCCSGFINSALRVLARLGTYWVSFGGVASGVPGYESELTPCNVRAVPTVLSQGRGVFKYECLSKGTSKLVRLELPHVEISAKMAFSAVPVFDYQG